MALEPRPDVRRGDPLPVRVPTMTRRIASGRHFTARQRWDGSFTVSGRRFPGKGGSIKTSGLGPFRGTGGWTRAFELDDATLAALADGPQTVAISVDVDVYDMPMEAYVKSEDRDAPPEAKIPPFASRRIDLVAPWTLQPADFPAVRVNRDPSHRPALERAVSVDSIERAVGVDERQGWFEFTMNVGPRPVALSCEVLLRAGGREWNVGQFDVAAAASTRVDCLEHVPDLRAGRADVVLRPTPRQAVRTVDLTEVWDGGDVVVRDVPVRTAPAE
jgi:hypothetical protein